jgi:hypothetical protein
MGASRRRSGPPRCLCALTPWRRRARPSTRSVAGRRHRLLCPLCCARVPLPCPGCLCPACATLGAQVGRGTACHCCPQPAYLRACTDARTCTVRLAARMHPQTPFPLKHTLGAIGLLSPLALCCARDLRGTAMCSQVQWPCCQQKGLPYRLMKPNHHTNVSLSPLECEIIDEC